MNHRRHRPGPARAPTLVALGLVLGFFLGLGLGAGRPAVAAREESPYPKLRVFAEALAYIERSYVRPVSGRELVYGALRGMVGTLDAHSLFMAPEVYLELKHNAAGEFGGVGLELAMREGRIVVVAPLDGTPAERAGLLPGDTVEAIDGQSVAGLSLFDALVKLRGAPGSAVELSVLRPADGPPACAVRLVRERIQLRAVDARVVGDRVIHLRIRTFQQNTFRSMVEALERMEDELGGRERVAAVILDLRNNPGGLLDQAVKVCDEFLDEGLIVSTDGRRPRDGERHLAHRGGRVRAPLAVLINRGSASASEIVAGALSDHKRAVLVGERSFGKGSVQTVVDLSDGSGLKVTVAHYYTPSHRSIQDLGIEPDVPVVAPPRLPRGPDATDPVLAAALEALAERSLSAPAAAGPGGASATEAPAAGRRSDQPSAR